LYNTINWYSQRFPFPKRGWKYFQSLLRLFRIATKVYKKKIFNGLFLYVNATDHIQKSVFWYGYYEKNVSLLWQSLIKEDSIVVDIGANIGYFSLLAAAKARSGRVISFEPVSLFRKQMAKNLDLNSVHNFELLPYCVSNKNELREVFIAGDDNLGMSGLHPPENFSGNKETVECIVIDDWRKNRSLPPVNFLKIDIEGAEKKALEGMTQLLRNDQPVIFIEIIDSLLSKFSSSATEIYSLLEQHHYKAYEIITPTLLQRIHDHKEGYDIVCLPAPYTLPKGINVRP
jgi:FkbM family methyltransferase